MNDRSSLVYACLTYTVVLGAITASGEDTHLKSEEPSAVGARFIVALAAEDVKSAKKCWIMIAGVEKLLKSITADQIPPGEQLPTAEEMKEYLKKRDVVVDSYVPKFIATMKTEGVDVKSLTHVRTEARFEKNGKPNPLGMAQDLFIQAKDANGVQVTFHIDDGVPFEGKWYFFDKPKSSINILKDNVSKRVDVE